MAEAGIAQEKMRVVVTPARFWRGVTKWRHSRGNKWLDSGIFS
jgi:hypothetical protein